jgi:hypothetical protein
MLAIRVQRLVAQRAKIRQLMCKPLNCPNYEMHFFRCEITRVHAQR